MLNPASDPQVTGSRRRAPRGTLLAREAYADAILQTLLERQGSTSTADAVQRVGELLDEQLTELDRAPLPSGEVRWKNAARFARFNMVKDGLLESASPHGIWTLTDGGMRRAKQQQRTRP